MYAFKEMYAQTFDDEEKISIDRKYFELEGALTTGSFFDITDTGPFNICKISFLFNNSMSIYMT